MPSNYTPVSMLRGDSTVIDQTPIVDGQILFDESRKCIYMDDGNVRNKYSGLGADSNVATVEDTTTSTHAYAKGDYVVVEGQLYEVTAAIAIGDTFAVGTNVAVTTVGAELTQINSDLADVDNTISNLPVKPNENRFRDNNGLLVTNNSASEFRDITCSSIFVNGSYLRNDNGINCIKASEIAYAPVLASDLKINGTTSLNTIISDMQTDIAGKITLGVQVVSGTTDANGIITINAETTGSTNFIKPSGSNFIIEAVCRTANTYYACQSISHMAYDVFQIKVFNPGDFTPVANASLTLYVYYG